MIHSWFYKEFNTPELVTDSLWLMKLVVKPGMGGIAIIGVLFPSLFNHVKLVWKRVHQPLLQRQCSVLSHQVRDANTVIDENSDR